ncbi:MAG: serine hydrolase domain-containing protein, partial [Gemmatimonadaceae bacterium]
MKTFVRASVLLALVGAVDLAGQERRYGLEVSTPAAEGLDTAKLRSLVARAKETNSSALVILKNGKLVLEWYEPTRRPIDATTVTPSVVSMLVGQLIDARKLDLDTPVSAFYPEWKEGHGARITVRHLLSHTSGLHPDPNSEKLEATGDFVGAALSSAIDQEPGSFFRYNNNGVNLLAGVASQAAGTRIDDFARSSLFQPLGVTEFTWSSDAVGTSLGMSGLQIHAVDLAKLGQLMLNGGVWDGKRLISSEWIAKSVEPGQPYQATHGLLWRLYYDRGQLK